MSETRDAALVLLELGRPEEALEMLARDFDVEDPWSWHARAAALLALDRYAEAARAAEDGLAEDPEHPYLLDLLAASRLALEDYAGAEAAILEALRLDAAEPELLTRYAHIVARVGQLDKAEKLVLRALSIDPENAYALGMHALIATARDDRGEALARSRELLRHVPESTTGHYLAGIAHFDEARVDDAADHLRRAVSLNPADEDIAENAREARARAHWLMWPLRPIMRWGGAPIWIGMIVVFLTLQALALDGLLAAVIVLWVVYCVYSWVVPSIVRRLVRR